MGVALKKVITGDQDLKRVQDAISDALISLQTGPFFGGNLISVALVSGPDNLVAHGLGRTPSVWILCGQDTGTDVWSPSSTSLGSKNANTTHINFKSGANCNVKVWVN